VVFNTAGAATVQFGLRCLAPRGRQIEISSSGRVEFDGKEFYRRELRLIGVNSVLRSVAENRALLEQIADGFVQQRLTLSRQMAEYPLDSAREAYEAVDKGAKQKVVLVMP